MSASMRPTTALRIAVGLLLLVLAAASCSKKVTSLVDASLVPPTYPEGDSNVNSHLVIYPDTPVRLRTWTDVGEPGPSSDDVLTGTEYIYESGPSAVVGALIDSTPPSRFEVLRQVGDGGYAPLFDHTLRPAKKWLQSQAELYTFADPQPFAAPNRDYIARGVIGSAPTNTSPLSNLARLNLANVPGNLQYLGRVYPDTTDDSAFVMKWQAVPNAIGYWITVYAYAPGFLSRDALIRSGLPHPLLPERLPEYFVGYIPAPTTQYKLGDPGPPGTRILATGIVLNNTRYCVRICAVDGTGQLLDYTGLSGALATAAGNANGIYVDFPLGAVVVYPTSKPPPPTLGAAAPLSAVAPLKPGEVRLRSEWAAGRRSNR